MFDEEGRIRSRSRRGVYKGLKARYWLALSFEMLTVSDTEDRMLRRRAKLSKLPCNTNEAISISKPKPQHDITSVFFPILGSFTTNHRDIHDFKGQRETLLHHSSFSRFFTVKH